MFTRRIFCGKIDKVAGCGDSAARLNLKNLNKKEWWLICRIRIRVTRPKKRRPIGGWKPGKKAMYFKAKTLQADSAYF